MLTSATHTPRPRKARRLSKARTALRRAAAYLFPAAALFLSAAPGPARTFAQTPAQKEAPAAVSGRVTDGERGVAGVSVVLMANDPPTRLQPVARARTDAEGNYHLTNVPPGRYKLLPFAPTYIVQGMTTYEYPPGKPLNLGAGESVEDIDFRLERGGVITGRVTDAEGNPVVAEAVSVVPAGNKKELQQQRGGPLDVRDYATDDRGVYRIYGLQPGTYLVSVGQGGNAGAVSYGRRKLYRRTFYPEATEQSQAKAVEVTAGGETTDIDITLGRAVKTYRASGRFVNAETGQPVAGVSYGYGPATPDGRFGGGFGGGFTTDARGEFQTEGLMPGHYTIFTSTLDPRDAAEFYSEPVTFDVVDSDVTGIVVKLRTGASVSGVVTLEGVGDGATASRLLSSIRLYGIPESPNQRAGGDFARTPSLGADGSFRFAGLRPGKLRISLSAGTKGPRLSRVELNGTNVTGGIEVAEGAQVSGVRVVVSYGSGVIRGQVSFTNGAAPPPGSRLIVFARLPVAAPAEGAPTSWAEADARGRFIIEGLPAGEYEVRARVLVTQPGARPSQSESQHVSLAEGGDMSVTLNVDLSAPLKGGRP